ncbi:MAG: hypothetical protein E7566_06690 [Ruminococcaceae bacterium]|nr:hypothetical protein [Oscillospiraceae bacterium]
MFKKLLSMLLVSLLILSLSVTFVSAQEFSDVLVTGVATSDEVSTDDEISTSDEVATDDEVSTSDEVSTDDEVSTSDEISTDDEILADASFDEAYAYLVSVIEATQGVNEKHYTDESYEVYITAKVNAGMAHLNAYDDIYTTEELLMLADELLKAYENLESLIFGDSNGDRKVNIKDVTEIQKHLAGIVTLSEKRLLSVDINRDGQININDATEIQKFLAGIIKNRYIYYNLYIVDLRIELLALIEQGQELTVGKTLTAESFNTYMRAESNALSAYNCESWDEASIVEEAIEELKIAIEAIEYKSDKPQNPETPDGKRYIDIKGFDEYRVGMYNHDWEPVSFIPKNAQELQEIFSKVDTEYMSRVELPTRYDDSYFEDNALIVTFFIIGGSGSSQNFGSLTVEGDTLTIKRYVTQPTSGPCDMDYRLTLFEVEREDVEGVTQFVNDVEYSYTRDDIYLG